VAARPREELERTQAEKWCPELTAEGVETRTLAIDAEPTAALLTVANDCDADLIVVGRRGEGGFEELLLGSVPSPLALYANRPVLIVPEDR
jgi:nucleotide-binding universal stress UspA family protein